MTLWNCVTILFSRSVFLKLFCFFYDSTDVGNLISCSFAFSKSNLYIWKFSVHVLLKPSLKDPEHNLTSMGNVLCEMWKEHNCKIFWTFFGTVLLWNWKENWSFWVLWPLLSFPNLLTYWVSTLRALFFRFVLNNVLYRNSLF